MTDVVSAATLQASMYDDFTYVHPTTCVGNFALGQNSIDFTCMAPAKPNQRVVLIVRYH